MSFYEIVELADGDIALQRDGDQQSEPLVRIRFSEESLAFLGNEKFNVAKAMIEAGMDAASDIAEENADDFYSDDEANSANSLLH